jgi:methanol--5-hydroxybenzimidazolylcobamide Co-methyltransferase
MLEQLWYDCKLMNEATRSGDAIRVRDLLTMSDVRTSPEALVLSPESCIRIANAIISTPDRLQRAFRAAREALAIIDEAVGEGRLAIPEVEQNWIGMIRSGMDEFEALGDAAATHYAKQYKHLFVSSEYGI